MPHTDMMMMIPSRKKPSAISGPVSQRSPRHRNTVRCSKRTSTRQKSKKISKKKKKNPARKSSAAAYHGGADSNSACVGTVPGLNSSGSTSTVNWGTPQELPGLVQASQGNLQRVDGSMFGLDQPGLLLGTYSGIL